MKRKRTEASNVELTDEEYAKEAAKWAKVKMLCDYFNANPHLRKYKVLHDKTVDLMDEIFLGGQTLKQVSEKLEG